MLSKSFLDTQLLLFLSFSGHSTPLTLLLSTHRVCLMCAVSRLHKIHRSPVPNSNQIETLRLALIRSCRGIS